MIVPCLFVYGLFRGFWRIGQQDGIPWIGGVYNGVSDDHREREIFGADQRKSRIFFGYAFPHR